jgi:DNA-directed RNA polymerase subunit RPC12/RpoP
MSYKKMCGVIAKAGILSFKEGVPATAEEIFNYSSTGELYMIPAWFMEAIAALRMMGRLDNNDKEVIKEFFGIDQGESQEVNKSGGVEVKEVTVKFDPANQEWRAKNIIGELFRCHCGSTVAEVIELTKEESKDSSWAMHGIKCSECGMRYAMKPEDRVTITPEGRKNFVVAELHPLGQPPQFIEITVSVAYEDDIP